ncbi:MAG: adenine phosphoribosyltransferase [Gemmatimonadota bacterium]
MTDLKQLVRSIPDYPKPGILFRDITTLLSDARGFAATIEQLAERYGLQRLTHVAGIEARGFIIGGALAHRLGTGFIPIRKKGKLPAKTIGHDYALEYGTDRVEMHVDAVAPGDRVLLVDDLIATGGTAVAGLTLLQSTGATVVEGCFVIELPDLGGRQRLESAGCPVFALLEFEGH